MSSLQNNPSDAELEKKLKRASHARTKPSFDYGVESLGGRAAHASDAGAADAAAEPVPAAPDADGDFEDGLDFSFDAEPAGACGAEAPAAPGQHSDGEHGEVSPDADAPEPAKPDDAAAEERRAARRARREARAAERGAVDDKEAGSEKVPRAKRDSSGKKASSEPEPKTVAARLKLFGGKHEWLVGVGICLFAVAGLALTFWFVVFSGIASSADFLYNQF